MTLNWVLRWARKQRPWAIYGHDEVEGVRVSRQPADTAGAGGGTKPIGLAGGVGPNIAG